MRKFLPIILAVLLIFTITACSGGTATKLTGTPDDILTQVLGDAAAAMPTGSDPIPMALPNSAITADNCTNILGISNDDFTKYVEAASESMAAIGSFAHEIIMLQAKNTSSAATLKNLLASSYNSHKWICVYPQESSVIDSGAYVMLVASRADITDAAVTAFKNLAGTTGDLNTFYQSADDTGATGTAGGNGGMAISPMQGQTN